MAETYSPQNFVPAQQNYIARDLFVYELDMTVAAGLSATSGFTIQADSDFLWTKGTFFADIAAAAQTASSLVIPLASLLITDTGSGRQLMNTAVPITSLFGTGQLPFILPRQRLFLARSLVNITINNFDAAADYNIKLSFIGEKAFRG
jgi:hypothetical protein